MSWDPDFVRDLGRGHLPLRFAVQSVPLTDDPELAIASFAAGGPWIECIDPSRSRISHGELQVPSWTRTGTSVSIGVTVDLRRRTRPGQVVRLLVGLRGRDVGGFSCVLVAAVRGLRWSGGLWSLELVDLVYSLQSRISRGALSGQLFYHLVNTTTLTSSYTPGDGGLDVVDVTSAFTEVSTADGGLLQIEPDGGEPFFLQFSGTAPNQITGCTATAVLETTAVAAPAGSVVRGCVNSDTHPLNTIRRLLVSTGTGNNGSRDVLPERAGYGLPEELIAAHDIERHVRLSSPDSGSNDWVAIATGPVDDGLGWMTEFLRGGGFFLGLRQGRITARAVADPSRAELPDTYQAATGITVESYDAWDPSLVEALLLHWDWPDGTTYTTASTEVIDTLPMMTEIRHSMPYVFENLSGWGDSLDARLRPYLLRRGERLTIRQAGLGLAAAAPGDCVELTTGQITSRYAQEGHDFRGRRTLCVGGGPDWFSGSVRLSLLSHVPAGVAT